MANKRPYREYVECPTCNRNAWEHRHSMAQGLAVVLLKFVKAYNGEPINLTDEGFNHNEKCNFQKLKYFGLVSKESLLTTKDKEKKGGFWKLTSLGRAFALDGVEIPKHVWTYNDTVIERENELTTIKLCLKDDVYWKRYEEYIVEMREKFKAVPDWQMEMAFVNITKRGYS